MERRDFIRKASGTAVGAAFVGGCSGQSSGGTASARPRIRWRLASSFPRSLDTIFGASEVMANRVEELTGGQFSIRVYPAGEIVPGLQVLDGVQQNNVDMGHSAGYYYIGKNPALVFDTAVPFGLTARQQVAWMKAGGLDLMREVYADFNIINFPGGNTGTQMGGWFRNPVNSLEELKGLKMRIPGLGGKVMSRLGVTVQVLAGGDIYPALERGAIDATEWVGPYDDQKLGFHKVAKNYYYPGWLGARSSIELLCKQKFLRSPACRIPSRTRNRLGRSLREHDGRVRRQKPHRVTRAPRRRRTAPTLPR